MFRGRDAAWASQVQTFYKRALAQICLLAWQYSWGILGGGLCMGKGALLVWHLCCDLRVTSHALHQDVPFGWYQYVSLELFLGILRGPGGAPLVRYLCKTHKSLHGSHV